MPAGTEIFTVVPPFFLIIIEVRHLESVPLGHSRREAKSSDQLGRCLSPLSRLHGRQPGDQDAQHRLNPHITDQQGVCLNVLGVVVVFSYANNDNVLLSGGQGFGNSQGFLLGRLLSQPWQGGDHCTILLPLNPPEIFF